MNTKQNLSFVDFVDDKLKNCPELAPLTLKSYKSHFEKIKYFAPAIQFTSINKQFIEDYRAFLLKRGKISAALGHTDIKTTRIYAHLLEKTKLEAFHVWDDL